MELTGKQRRYLRGLAHHLKPTVQIGNAGVTAQVVEKTREELEIHELIKIRANDADRDDVKEAAEGLVVATKAALVQILGKTIILYAKRKEDPEIRLPK